jgi:DNA-binding beta-propeller fold protein YncE
MTPLFPARSVRAPGDRGRRAFDSAPPAINPDNKCLKSVLASLILLFVAAFALPSLASDQLAPQPTPQPLNPSSVNGVPLQIHDPAGRPVGGGFIVSVAPLDGDLVFLCNYANIFLLDRSVGVAYPLDKPAGVEAWYPTGLKFIPSTRTLYVANYLGKDVLVFHVTANDRSLQLTRRIQDPELVSPENIDVTPDGSLLVAADYDGNALIAFDKDGTKLWRAPLARAHGVAISPTEKAIYATSLALPAVAKLDFSGNQIKQVAGSGWGKNQYMWPTGVDTMPDGSVVVTDAHIGKIRQLSPDLEEIRGVGANGLGPSWFNMPYGVRAVGKDTVLVVDTFKSRLLEVNLRTGAASSIFRFAIFKGVDANGILRQATASELQGEPLGTGYVGRTNMNMTVKIPSLLGETNVNWHLQYNGLLSEDGKRFASLTSAFGIYSGQLFYWMQAKEVALNGKSYVILGSPEAAAWLVIRDGIAVPLVLRIDLWTSATALLTEPDIKFDYADLIEAAERKLTQFRKDLSSGVEVQEALCRNIFVECGGPEGARNSLNKLAKSFRGKELVADLIAGAPLPDLGARARAVVESIEADSGMINLPEVFLANTLLKAIE